MDSKTIVGLILLLLVFLVGGGLLYYVLFLRKGSQLENLLGASRSTPGLGTPSQERAKLQDDPTGEHYERLKKATKKQDVGKQKVSLEERFFHAGIFSPKEKARFKRKQFFMPFIGGGIALAGCILMGEYVYLPIVVILGVVIGFQLPSTLLDRKIKFRDEEIMFYLPLVIEQISIGVSSSLDIGPCLQRVVAMADERDTHNVVTELMKYTLSLIRTGMSLEDGLNEVGKKSGHTELKHSFMALAQVAKHGGEISRQLQELADSVSSQRETRIEGKIKRLELAATGPVALVFFGFLIILLTEVSLQLKF